MTNDAFQTYQRFGHRRVNGWMDPQVLQVVAHLTARQRQDGTSGSVAEIGVHHGRLFIGLHLTNEPGERSLAIDLFDNQEQNIDDSGRGDLALLKRNIARHASAELVDILASDSTTLKPQDILNRVGPVRLFSVDGGHTAEIVLHDMRTASQSLTSDGIIIADDVFNPQWPGVADGTYQFLDEEGDSVVPFAVGFNKVFFARPQSAGEYRHMVDDLATRKCWESKSSVMHGHPVVVAWKPAMRRRPVLLVKRFLRQRNQQSATSAHVT